MTALHLNQQFVNAVGYSRYVGWMEALTGPRPSTEPAANRDALAMLVRLSADAQTKPFQYITTNWDAIITKFAEEVDAFENVMTDYLTANTGFFLLELANYLAALDQVNAYADDSPGVFPTTRSDVEYDILLTLRKCSGNLAELGVRVNETFKADSPIAVRAYDLWWTAPASV